MSTVSILPAAPRMRILSASVLVPLHKCWPFRHHYCCRLNRMRTEGKFTLYFHLDESLFWDVAEASGRQTATARKDIIDSHTWIPLALHTTRISCWRNVHFECYLRKCPRLLYLPFAGGRGVRVVIIIALSITICSIYSDRIGYFWGLGTIALYLSLDQEETDVRVAI